MYMNGPNDYGSPPWWWYLVQQQNRPQPPPSWTTPLSEGDISPRQVRKAMKIKKLFDELAGEEGKKKEKKEETGLLKGNFTKVETFLMLSALSLPVAVIEILIGYKLWLMLPIPH